MTERFALPPSLAETRNYVDGAFVASGRTFDNVSPLTGRVLLTVVAGNVVHDPNGLAKA